MLRIRLLYDPLRHLHPLEVQQAHVGLILEATYYFEPSEHFPQGFYLVTAVEYLRAMCAHNEDAFLWLDSRIGDAVEEVKTYSAFFQLPGECCEPYKGAVN